MNLAQNEIVNEPTRKSLIYNLFIIAFFGHLILNFLGTSFVLYSFIIVTFLAVISLFYYEWTLSFQVLCFLCLIEGQGRILFGYNPVFRILFDILTLIAILRSAIFQKHLFAFNFLPKFTSFMIVLHFLWFILEIFNPDGASVFASLATAKFYVFPFLLLFSLFNNPIDVTSVEFQKFLKLFLTSLGVISLLCVFQKYQGSDYMNSLSSNYSSLFAKFERFQGSFYRPWGTSFTPGGFSIFYSLNIGLIFLFGINRNQGGRRQAKFIYVLLMVLVLLSLFVLFISQVRSALIKTMAVVITTTFMGFLGTKFVLKRTALILISLVISLFGTYAFVSTLPSLDEKLDLEVSINRFSDLGDSDKISSSRATTELVTTRLATHVDWPLGFGLGMTTGFLPDFQVARDKRSLDLPDYVFWNGDNLILFFFLELGVGAIFILFTYLSFPYYLLSMTLESLKNFTRADYLIISTAFVQVLVISLGNWGAATVVYNPESFFTMFWISIGFHQFYSTKNKNLVENEKFDKINL